MNFDYIQDAKPATEELQQLYHSLYRDLEHSEELYWSNPGRCGSILRKATEKICHIYNSFYELGFPQDALLEDYLCYTDKDDHNRMVSKFLSVIRSEQRDHLEWLRVWGDECIFMDENPEEIAKSQDKLYLNVKKMMTIMLDVTREMCEKLDHMEELDDWIFEEHILPGYRTPEEIEAEEELKREEAKKEKKKSFFSFLRK